MTRPATRRTKSIAKPRAREDPKPKRQPPASSPATGHSKTIIEPRADLLDTIKTLGELLDDLEQVRVANGNRIGALERERGDSLPALQFIQEELRHVEHQAELELCRTWRKHPLAPWAKSIPGLGEKLIARLIAVIGDPSLGSNGHWEVSEDRVGKKQRTWVVDEYWERNVGKLWAYCGHGDPERAGQVPKNATQEELFKRGNPKAKKAVWKIAAQFRRTVGSQVVDEAHKLNGPADAAAYLPADAHSSNGRSPFRDLYEQARERYAERTHAKPCVRCGPSGKPAPIGSPWSKGHQMAAADRYVGKEFLKALWIEARRLHTTHEIQSGIELT